VVRGAQGAGNGPPLIRPVHDRRGEPALQHPGQAEQKGGDARRTLHPRGPRGKQRRVLAMLYEPPPRPGLVADGALDQGVGHDARRLQQGLGPLRVPTVPVRTVPVSTVLSGVEQHVPDPGGPAAPAVVVPEPGAEPLRDTGGENRAQAAAPQRADLEPGDLPHPGPRQRSEQV